MIKHRVLLVDGNNLLFRAFYANQWLPKKGALYGFARMLNGFLTRHHYFDVVVAFDQGRGTFRHKLFADYKAQRTTLPPQLLTQLQPARAFLQASGIQYFELPDYEADDILMALAGQASGRGYKVDILSGDRDLLQAISPTTRVLVPVHGLSDFKTIDEAAFLHQYHFPPALLPDYKALVGDSSDNFKGVIGIGPVMAQKLVTNHGSLENIMTERDAIPTRIQRLLTQQQQTARRCKQMATLVRDINFNYQFRPLRLNKAGQNHFFAQYNFPTLVWADPSA